MISCSLNSNQYYNFIGVGGGEGGGLRFTCLKLLRGNKGRVKMIVWTTGLCINLLSTFYIDKGV